MKTETPEHSTIAHDWEARGFSCSVWIDPPGQVWKDFVHDVDELLMVITGEVMIEIQGRRHRPTPGEEILIPAGMPHTVRNVGSTNSEWLYGYRRT